MITGHTAWNSHVELFSYAEFDSVDRKDRYRLMDLSARDCNRDGAALRYMAEKLYEAHPNGKLILIEGAEHGQAMYIDPETYFDSVFAFLGENMTDEDMQG